MQVQAEHVNAAQKGFSQPAGSNPESSCFEYANNANTVSPIYTMLI